MRRVCVGIAPVETRSADTTGLSKKSRETPGETQRETRGFTPGTYMNICLLLRTGEGSDVSDGLSNIV